MTSSLRKTPLDMWHRSAGARMVPFAGWEMPVQYAGVLAEHRAVRTSAGLFDVSHMGEIRVRGDRAGDLVQGLTPNDVRALTDGRAQYSALLTDRGTFIDDLLVYRFAVDDYLLVVNAANAARDLAWIRERSSSKDLTVVDESEETALIALQGPRASFVLEALVDGPLDLVRPFSFGRFVVAGRPCTLSRTGYTGEDGFEIYLANADGLAVWTALIEEGAPLGVVPVGLAARDTLRLEAGLMLHGNDIDEDTTPYEAGLGWIVKLDRGDFVGREALVAEKASGPRRHLVGLEMVGRRIARSDARVYANGRECGTVTSGTFSPTLERPVAMALIDATSTAGDGTFEVDVRGRLCEARSTPLPFYRRARE